MFGLLAALGVSAKTVAAIGVAADVMLDVGSALVAADTIGRILSDD